MQPLADVPLAPKTSMGLGGPASFYARVQSEPELKQALHWAKERQLALRILGGGSNVVVADAGFDGLVIHVDLPELRIHPESAGAVRVDVGAGVEWARFVDAMVQRGYQGVECLAGIPGRVGASPIQNIGAYGQEVAETIVQVSTLEVESQRRREFTADECRFAYRDSFFKSEAPDAFVVTSVSFLFRPQHAPRVGYAELARHLQSQGSASPDLVAVRNAVLTLRGKKSMLASGSDENRRSCGSFFVNPILTREHLRRIEAASQAPVPRFELEDGRVKLPAAWLIEQAGLAKGTRQGNVGLSTKHTLAMVCHAGATSQELLRFAGFVRGRVREHFGVQLAPEPNFWGFSQSDDGLPRAE